MEFKGGDSQINDFINAGHCQFEVVFIKLLVSLQEANKSLYMKNCLIIHTHIKYQLCHTALSQATTDQQLNKLESFEKVLKNLAALYLTIFFYQKESCLI